MKSLDLIFLLHVVPTIFASDPPKSEIINEARN